MQLCQNFGILGGGFEHPKPPPRYATALRHGVDYRIYVKVIFDPFSVLCVVSFCNSVCIGRCFEVHIQVATLTSIKWSYCHFSITNLCPPCTKLSTFHTVFSRKLKILKGDFLRCRIILYLGKYSNGSRLKIVRLG